MSNKVIRVAQVIGMAVNGGTESFWMNYYRHIDRSKVQFDFLVESTSKIINKEEIESMGGRVIIIPSYKNPIKYVKTLTRFFKENKYDIVHSNMNALSVFTLKAAKKAGIKIRIAHSHATTSKKEVLRNIAKQILKKFSKKYATHYFAVSDVAARWLFGNKTVDNGKVYFINSFDVSKYLFDKIARQKLREKLNIKDDEIVIGNIGRMVQTKNQEFVIKLFAELSKCHPNYKLIFGGEGPLKEELANSSKKYHVDEKVIFYGADENIAKLYSALDLYIFPSLYEGLGLTLLEAQASGLPCLASTGVSQETKILDEVRYLDLKEDLSIWIKNIEDLLNIDVNREQCGDKCMASSFAIESSAKELMKIYFDLLSE